MHTYLAPVHQASNNRSGNRLRSLGVSVQAGQGAIIMRWDDLRHPLEPSVPEAAGFRLQEVPPRDVYVPTILFPDTKYGLVAVAVRAADLLVRTAFNENDFKIAIGPEQLTAGESHVHIEARPTSTQVIETGPSVDRKYPVKPDELAFAGVIAAINALQEIDPSTISEYIAPSGSTILT